MSGSCEPLNTGQFLLQPTVEGFHQMYWTVRAGRFNEGTGWNETGEVEASIVPECAARAWRWSNLPSLCRDEFVSNGFGHRWCIQMIRSSVIVGEWPEAGRRGRKKMERWQFASTQAPTQLLKK